MRLSIRGLITSEGSFGRPKNPIVAFIIRFLVSVVSFGSTETSVVQALKAKTWVCKSSMLESENPSSSSRPIKVNI
nr:hypothetical protein Iba_chr01bCG2410 [Ipomoea batatas]